MATQTVLPMIPRSGGERRAQAWAWGTLAFFIVVVLEGAVVRATSSGAGCGDKWPLCNGEILPHHPRVATIIEFAHRSLTGISSAMFAVLVAWTFSVTKKGHPARRAAVWSAVLLFTEAMLGAVLVLGHFVEKNASTARVVVQCVHFTNTMLLLGATTAVAVLLGRTWSGAGASKMRAPMLTALLAMILTGATGSVAALADTIFPSTGVLEGLKADFAAGSPLLVRMRWIHPAATVLLIAAALWMMAALRRRGDGRLARLIGANLGLQLLIGVANVLLLAPTWVQVLHLLGADLFWVTLCGLAVPVFLPRAFEGLSGRS